MKSKKLLACLMAGAMVLSMAACGQGEAPAATEPNEPVAAAPEFTIGDVSIDFADGNFAFIGNDTSANPAAKPAEISLTDEGVKLVGSGKIFAGIQMDELLGDAIADVKTVKVALKTENADGFNAVSGSIYTFLGDECQMYKDDWSIYLEKQNPKWISVDLAEAATSGNYVVVSLENDTAANPTDLIIEAISFEDANGNVLAADTTAEYKGVVAGPDRSNLFGIADAVDAGIAQAAGGWAQTTDCVPTAEAVEALMQPGSVVEIEYTSTTGNMWLVMTGGGFGWYRVGVGDCDGSGQQYSYVNGSKTVAQVTYEQIAAEAEKKELDMEDVASWFEGFQCESDGDYEVFSVKVGKQAPNYVVLNAVDAGIAQAAGGWAQTTDCVPTAEAVEALMQPGSVVEIEYTSTTGNMWLVMTGGGFGWYRVGVGDCDGSGQQYSAYNSTKTVAWVTYEQIAAEAEKKGLDMEDVTSWFEGFQCESDGDYEVYSVKVGQAAQLVPNFKRVDAGIAQAAGGWAQTTDCVPTAEAVEALMQPGAVAEISYTSTTGNMWLVMTGGGFGWYRVGVGDCDGSGQQYSTYNADKTVAQVTYEQIAAEAEKKGLDMEDVASWFEGFQCESDGDYEVFSVTIGQTK